MKHRAILASILVLVLSFGLTTSVGSSGSINDLTNAYRASQGLILLGTEPWLTLLAEAYVQEIYPKPENFHHVDLVPRMQGCWELYGDNIAWRTTFEVSAEDFVNAWINSPIHLANIVDNFTIQGSSMYAAPDGNTYAVQIFVRTCQLPPPPPPSVVTPAPPLPVPTATPNVPSSSPLEPMPSPLPIHRCTLE